MWVIILLSELVRMNKMERRKQKINQDTNDNYLIYFQCVFRLYSFLPSRPNYPITYFTGKITFIFLFINVIFTYTNIISIILSSLLPSNNLFNQTPSEFLQKYHPQNIFSILLICIFFYYHTYICYKLTLIINNFNYFLHVPNSLHLSHLYFLIQLQNFHQFCLTSIKHFLHDLISMSKIEDKVISLNKASHFLQSIQLLILSISDMFKKETFIHQ